uniref:Tetraspanin n=1 Tax=Romanomermis culicivorax TaxID=13658 RepID=A0A915IIW7_ROMCU
MDSSNVNSTMRSRQTAKYVTAVKFCLISFNSILVVSAGFTLVALLVVMYQLTPLITALERTKILGTIVALVEPICLSLLCVMVCVSAFFSYCAITKPSTCGMAFYIGMLCSLAIIVSIILGMKVTDRRILEKSVADSLFEAIEKSSRDKTVLQELNKIQNTYVCCGVHSYTDWLKNKNTKLPSSCCDDFHDECDQNSMSFRKESCIKLIMYHQYYRFSISDKLAYALALFGIPDLRQFPRALLNLAAKLPVLPRSQLVCGILLSSIYMHMIRVGSRSNDSLPRSTEKRSIFSDKSNG